MLSPRDFGRNILKVTEFMFYIAEETQTERIRKDGH